MSLAWTSLGTRVIQKAQRLLFQAVYVNFCFPVFEYVCSSAHIVEDIKHFARHTKLKRLVEKEIQKQSFLLQKEKNTLKDLKESSCI